MEHLKLLVQAHKEFNEALKVFEKYTGLDTTGNKKCVQLYGEESCKFLLFNGGIEYGNEIVLKVDGMDVICLKNI